MLGCNAYCYCGNNPCNYRDYNGHVPEETVEELNPFKNIENYIKRICSIVYLVSFEDGTPQRHAMVRRMCELLGTPYSSVQDCGWFASEIIRTYNSYEASKFNNTHVATVFNNRYSSIAILCSNFDCSNASFGDLLFFNCPDCHSCNTNKTACRFEDRYNIHHVGIYLSDGLMIDCGDLGVTVRPVNAVIPSPVSGKYNLFAIVKYPYE